MLQTINERTKGLIAWTIIILVAATFAIFGAENFFQSSANNTVAQINGVEISQNQLRTESERFRRQRLAQQSEDFQVTQAIDDIWNQQALERLIFSELMQQTGKSLGLRVSLEQAHATIVNIPYLQEDGQFSQQLFQQVLSSELDTPDSYVQRLREGMLISQLNSGFVATAFTLDSDLQIAIKLLAQTRDINYLIIDAAKFADIAKPSDEKIRQYYDTHLDNYTTPEKISIEYVELSQQALLDKIEISDQAVNDYYDLNTSLYTTPAQWRIAHILIQSGDKSEEKLQALNQDIAQAKSFTSLVKRYSDDLLSVKEKGILPWFTSGSFNPAIETEVAQLNIGEISKPIVTNNGYEIIKLIDKKEKTQRPLADVKEEIINQLKRNDLDKQFAQLSEDLIHLAYLNPESLNVAAEQLELPINTTELFTEKGGNTELTQHPRVLAVAFNNEIKEQGVNSDLIVVNTDKVIVLRRKQYQPASQIPLTEVKEKIVAELIDAAKQQKAETIGNEILAKLQAGEDKKTLASMVKAKWQSVAGLKRGDDRVPLPIANKAFQLAPIVGSANFAVSNVMLENGNYVIVQVTNIQAGDMTDITKEQTQIIRNQIENARGLMAFDLYTNDLHKQADIQVSNH